MAETVKRFRETVAQVVLGISVLYILLSLVRGGYLVYRHTPLAETARQLGGSSLSIVMVLLVVAATLACVLVRPVTPKGRKLVRTGAVVIGIAALLEAAFLVMGVFNTHVSIFVTALEVLGGVLEVAIKTVAAHLLWRAGARAPEPVPAVEQQASTEVAVVAEPERQQASWRADQAAGAVWTRAGDAASGAAATTWGHPGSGSAGWKVAGDSPAAAEEPQAPRGPWATAGDLAAGEALPDGQTAAGNGSEPPRAGEVSWEPVRRPD
ncbi:hypothetical protein AAEX63_11510 [Luteococcus sp. H138]|uniref:hypothetical protein n=1 Tax=unclassified Luteococcus TaxID=2639923 RepID=UPI00313CF23D